MEYKLSQFQYLLILEVATVQCMSIFSDFGHFLSKTLDSVTMAMEVKTKEKSMSDFVLSTKQTSTEGFIEIGDYV